MKQLKDLELQWNLDINMAHTLSQYQLKILVGLMPAIIMKDPEISTEESTRDQAEKGSEPYRQANA